MMERTDHKQIERVNPGKDEVRCRQTEVTLVTGFQLVAN